MNCMFWGIALIIIYLSCMLTIIQIKQDRSIGNFTWGGLVMLLTVYSFFTYSQFLPRQILVTTLIMLWGIRLAAYTYLRYKKGADPRFIAWQQQHGTTYAFIYNAGWIFMLNGFMGLVMSTPALAINTSATPGLTFLDWIGLALWIIGFYFETVSDYQLFIFRKDPTNTGKVLGSGLWRYSRHPNYFGEIVMWWGIYLLAVSVPCGWLTIICPGAITITLLFVTGIPWLEKAMDNNPAYQEYKKRTSILIPWAPKQ